MKMGLPLMPATVRVMLSRGCGVLMMTRSCAGLKLWSVEMTSTSNFSGCVPEKTVRP
jgi:hypothetical protein